MKANLAVERGDQRGHPFSRVARQHGAGGIHDVDAVGSVTLHQPRLLHQRVGRAGVRHHEKADGFQAQFLGQAEVLFGNVGFGALGRDPHNACAPAGRFAQILLRADAGDQQNGDLRPGTGSAGLRDQVPFVDSREAVLHGRAAQSVTVRDFNHRNPGLVERPGHGPHMVDSELMAHGMGAVAQAAVGDAGRLHDLAAATADAQRRSSAMAWATRQADAVMMSRLPA